MCFRFHVGKGDDLVPLVHLWGTPYEMGYAHGTICNETATKLFNGVWAYLEEQIESALNGIWLNRNLCIYFSS